MIAKIRARVSGGRLVFEVDGESLIVGRLVVCPCCGHRSLAEAPCRN